MLKRNNSESQIRNRLSNRISFNEYSFLKSTFRDSINIARVKRLKELNVIVGGEVLNDQIIYYADTELANIFSFNILDGSIKDFKRIKSPAILSSSTSLKYFKTIQASGRKFKVFAFGDTVEFTVAAVYKDFPRNSHEQFDLFFRFDSAQVHKLNFDSNDIEVYGKTLQPDFAYQNIVFSERSKSENESYELQPISDIYFGPRVVGEDSRHGDSYSIFILISLGALILFLALSNFSNLTILTLPHRSKELAVRKLSGTSQVRLWMGFAIESFLIVGASLILSVLLLVTLSVQLELILFIDIRELAVENNLAVGVITLGLVLIYVCTPLLVSYKFLYSTPNRLLSIDSITFPRFKRVIIFLQLGISIFLIAASLVINRQVDYSLLKEPGRNHDQVVYVDYPKNLTNEGLRRLQVNWKKNKPNIIDVIGVSQLPDRVNSKELNSKFYFIAVDPEFSIFFNLQLTEGRWFKANSGDSIILVNELGQKILGANSRNVIGIFKDIGGQFDQPEKPLKLRMARFSNYNFLCIRILEVDIRKTVQYLSGYFGTKGNRPSVKFLDKRFEDWLSYQDRINALSKIMAMISGLLSCLAIYSLSISIVRDKMKQIVIHKLCGASVLRITGLLVREFMLQMIMAILIFGPLTYIVLNELLRNFFYSTHFIWTDPVFPVVFCFIAITLLCASQAFTLNKIDLTSSLKG